MFCLSVMISFCVLALVRNHNDTCYDKFEYVFKVLERLSDVEEKVNLQVEGIASLTSQLQDVEGKLNTNSPISGDTYTRWRRSSCPNGTVLVYDGFAAGSFYTSKGGAANYLCLPKQPVWNDKSIHISWPNNIYGAEYQPGSGLWSSLSQYDVPCVVCRVPNRSILMLPGKNKCHGNYSLEYSGYLMSGLETHDSATEFVCVDDAPVSIPESSENQNGRLFYFVTAKCGSLKCPPYDAGKRLTCAACSI